MNNTMDKEDNSKGDTGKVKVKLKIKATLPKEGVDLLGIVKKLSDKKFGKR